MPEPLSGITVVEMAVALQGPSAALYLRDQGAEVIKIEPPWGDAQRFHRGAHNDSPRNAPQPGFVAVSRGKKSVCLDLHQPTGREVVTRLLNSADVFLTNYREPFLRGMGLDYETLAAAHPQLVWARVSGFGPEGPDANKPMLDGAAQARGGLLSLSGYQGQTPTGPGAAIADLGGGMQLALGVVTALFARAQHGRGQKVETSSLGTQLWLQQWELTQCSITGRPLRAKGPYLPNVEGAYGAYDTKDGGVFLLALAQDEASWDALCVFGEMFELIGDEKWDSPGKRMGAPGKESAAELREVLKRGFASRTTAEWTEFMYSQPNLIMERVRDHAEVLNDEQNIANEYVVPMELPVHGKKRVIGNLVRMSETPGSVKGPPPELGEHTVEVMRQLGFDDDAVAQAAGEVEAARNAVAGDGFKLG
ncbi:MAG: CoA transferase [Gammaproteobacteria bacterium]|nr:CoA transferase [Gammaproteobacteria bacterium]